MAADAEGRARTPARVSRAGRVRYGYDEQGRLVLRRLRLLLAGTRDWRCEWDALDRLAGA